MANKKAAQSTQSLTPIEDLVQEVERMKGRIRQLSQQINKPDMELGVSVRLSVERRELEAYLHGILYALGEAAPLE